MKLRQIVTTTALAGIMALGIGCGDKAEEAPTAPVKTAEEIALEQKAAAIETYKNELVAYEAALTEQKAQYTHTVAGPTAMWDLVRQYGGKDDVATIDAVCKENGMKYLGLDPVVLRFEPMTSVMEDGKQVNCNILYEGQKLDFTYFAPQLKKPVMPE